VAQPTEGRRHAGWQQARDTRLDQLGIVTTRCQEIELAECLDALAGQIEDVVDALAADLPAVVIDYLDSARIRVVACD